MHVRYVTDILKMCMKKFNAYFFINLQGFVLHIVGVYCKHCLQPISCCCLQMVKQVVLVVVLIYPVLLFYKMRLACHK